MPTTDTSNTGVLTDPNGNRNPDEPGENVPTVFSLASHPVIGIAKAVTSIDTTRSG